jgi:hypothetical protein
MEDAIKTWTTKSGLEGCIRKPFALCGYVRLPKEHPAHGKTYHVIDVECHGGLTFSSFIGDDFWVGFDCAHAGDGFSIGISKMPGEVRDMAYVESEVEHLAEQLAAMGSPSNSDATGEK